MISLDHPNEPGRWTLLAKTSETALWRRDRDDPFPVSLFYILSPPRQAEVVYDEIQARALFEGLNSRIGHRAA